MGRESASQVESELGDGERLLWSGKPRQGVVFRPYDVFMIPFSLVWTSLAGFAAVKTLLSGASPFAALCSIVFMLAGFYLVFGRFIIDSMRRRKTFYGVTNQRVVIISGLFSRRVESLNLRTLSDLSFSEKRNGSGTIAFGAGQAMSWLWEWHGFPPWSGIGHSASTFELIENARQVYNLIREAQRNT